MEQQRRGRSKRRPFYVRFFSFSHTTDVDVTHGEPAYKLSVSFMPYTHDLHTLHQTPEGW
jgi:hypothetical protein